MRYLELTEFPLIPRNGLQKEAKFKQLAWSAGATKCFETSYNGKEIKKI